MSKISCDVCMDLMPLVKDGVASEDSVSLVREHIASCPECKKIYGGDFQENEKSEVMEQKTKNKVKSFLAFLTFLGMFFGVSLMLKDGMFYIAIITPVIGILSYMVYKWQALWKTPLILNIIFIAAYIVGILQGGIFNIFIFIWCIIIAVFTDIGVLIAGFLHFALRKEK